MPFLKIQSLTKAFLRPDGSRQPVIRVADFSLQQKEQVTLSGESGCGKTTFLHLIAGILKADGGTISLDGSDMARFSEPQRDRLRTTTLGYVFQTFNLLQGYTCLENVLLGMPFGPGPNRNLLYNKQGNRLTLAWPIGQVVAELFDKIGWFNAVLELVAYLVAVVAAGSVLASIYNSMNERGREIAILRALGAGRNTVFGVIVVEAASISALVVLVGFLVHGVILTSAATVIRSQTGVVSNPFALSTIMVWTALGMTTLGALAGVVPAMKAYRTDIADHLTPIS